MTDSFVMSVVSLIFLYVAVFSGLFLNLVFIAIKLYVFDNKSDQKEIKEGQAVIMALLDNLGKGASGQAVQNMDLMLGLS